MKRADPALPRALRTTPPPARRRPDPAGGELVAGGATLASAAQGETLTSPIPLYFCNFVFICIHTLDEISATNLRRNPRFVIVSNFAECSFIVT
jgi:hypothetical protein